MALTYRPLKLGGETTSADESKVGLDSAVSAANCLLDRGIIEGRQCYDLIGSRPSYNAADVGWGLGYGKYSQDTLWRLTMSGIPTGGTFTLSYKNPSTGNTYTTAGIVYDAATTDVYNALTALTGVEEGDVQIEGNQFPGGPMAIAWQGEFANLDVATMTVNYSGLTGGSSPKMVLTQMIAGGDYECFLVFIQKSGDNTATLYTVDLLNGNTWTQVETGLEASDWYCEQYAGNVYCLNGTAGMSTYTMGGGSMAWNNGQSAASPASPSISILPISGQNYSSSAVWPQISGIAAPAGGYTGWGGTPTATVQSFAGLANMALQITCPAAITTPTTVTFDVTLTSAFAGQFRDMVTIAATPISSGVSIDLSQAAISYVGATYTNQAPYMNSPGQAFVASSRQNVGCFNNFSFGNLNRIQRIATTKYQISLTIVTAPIGGVFNVVVEPFYSEPLTYLPPFSGAVGSPTTHYAYTYYRSSDGVESTMSPILTVTLPNADLSCFLTGSIPSSSGTGSPDTIYLYRQEQATGLWRRIQNVDCATWGFTNTPGTPVTFTDGWTETEIASFPEYNSSLLGGWSAQGFASPNAVQLGVWKGSLCVGTQRLVLISWVNNPAQFAPSPENAAGVQALDVNDTSQGVSEYVADNRAGDALAVFGLDALYIVTADSVYAVVGDIPLTASPPRRLPGSRGGLGTRAATTYSAGVLVGCPDGLWHYAVSRAFSGVDDGSEAQNEVTIVERGAWAALVAPGAAGLVVAEYLDEIWAVNGQNFLFLSRNKIWSSGTLADSMKAALSIRTRGLYWIDATGRLMLFSYSATGDRTIPTTWTYQTGIEVGMRTEVRGLLLSGKGHPTIAATTWDGGNGRFDYGPLPRGDDWEWFLDLHLQPGFRLQLTFSGTVGTDTIEQAVLEVESEVGRGR